MTRHVATTTTCDLCGYGGAYSHPSDFTQRRGYDFCRWCSVNHVHGTLSSGGHEVTLDGASWQCSCGTTYGAVVLKLRMNGVPLDVMDAVPGSLAAATASLHVNTPNWPRTH